MSWISDAAWDLLKFDDKQSMRVKSIIRATWYEKKFPIKNVDIPWLLDESWRIMQQWLITTVPWFYDMTCVPRIDSSVRVWKQIVEHIASHAH